MRLLSLLCILVVGLAACQPEPDFEASVIRLTPIVQIAVSATPLLTLTPAPEATPFSTLLSPSQQFVNTDRGILSVPTAVSTRAPQNPQPTQVPPIGSTACQITARHDNVQLYGSPAGAPIQVWASTSSRLEGWAQLDGWILVVVDGYYAGWISPESARVHGNCNLPLPTPSGQPTTYPTPYMELCRAVPNLPEAVVNIHNGPGTEYEVTNVFAADAVVDVDGRTANGWVHVWVHGPIAAIGYVPANEVALSGMCDVLPWLPDNSPTATPVNISLPTGVPTTEVIIPMDMCTVTAAQADVLIYSTPDTGSMFLGTMQPGPWSVVTAKSTTGWLRITLLMGEQAWVQVDKVNVHGQCDGLPVM